MKCFGFRIRVEPAAGSGRPRKGCDNGGDVTISQNANKFLNIPSNSIMRLQMLAENNIYGLVGKDRSSDKWSRVYAESVQFALTVYNFLMVFAHAC